MTEGHPILSPTALGESPISSPSQAEVQAESPLLEHDLFGAYNPTAQPQVAGGARRKRVSKKDE